MNDIHETPAPTLTADTAERIAKVIARSGVASRRDAEKMILAGRVTVNGKKVDSPALDVKPADKVAIDGKPIDAPQETRLWLYYKPPWPCDDREGRTGPAHDFRRNARGNAAGAECRPA
ncbi:S4 domain-containing protein [Rhodobacter capsulatus]|uniref:S4 domain-containing protein n=1 Tax=Rhodobacter capsulatus TaxID=1061 RepID=UPI004026D79C